MSDQDLVLQAVRARLPLGGHSTNLWTVALAGAGDGVSVSLVESVGSRYKWTPGRTHDFTVPVAALDGDVRAFVDAELEPLR